MAYQRSQEFLATKPSFPEVVTPSELSFTSLQKTLRIYQGSVGDPARFFKTKEGEYGAHDAFLGVAIPYVRSCAKAFKNLPFEDIAQMLASRFNEDRMAGFLILLQRYPQDCHQVYAFYWQHRAALNSWNLVDISAPGLLGRHLAFVPDKQELIPIWLAGGIWQRRSLMVASLFFIRQGLFDLTFELVGHMGNDTHDMVQKAVGWMLREVGRKNPEALYAFLAVQAAGLPRPVVRIALEVACDQVRSTYGLNPKKLTKVIA